VTRASLVASVCEAHTVSITVRPSRRSGNQGDSQQGPLNRRAPLWGKPSGLCIQRSCGIRTCNSLPHSSDGGMRCSMIIYRMQVTSGQLAAPVVAAGVSDPSSAPTKKSFWLPVPQDASRIAWF